MDCKTAQQKIMPYIERRLGMREMEDFIDHMHSCKTCREELEVYFTIYYALEKLDQDEQASYDIPKMLERDLKRTRTMLERKNIFDFTRRMLVTILALTLGLILITGAETAIYGTYEKTTVHRFFGRETEPPQTTAVTETVRTEAMTDETEPETNRKRQVIVKTPETEAMTEGIGL